MWTRRVNTRSRSISLTLPKALCRALEINTGDIMLVNYSKEGVIQMRKLSQMQVEALGDKVPGKVPVIT